MRIADRIAEALVSRGSTTGFGIVGGGNIHLWDAIHPRIALISCHHEQAAVMAATAYYRACGRLAPVIVTTGAGSANALTGVLAAYMDSIPVLVISGNENSAHLRVDERVKGVQGYRSDLVAAPVTKWAATVRRAEDCLAWLDEAIACALTPRRGPVWVDVPKDIQNAMG